jgi:hypothetical protein
VAGFRDAVVDPASDLRLVVAADVAPVVRVSDDGGMTWSPLDTGLPAAKGIRILMDPADGDRLVVAFDTAPPYESTDGGQSWTPVPVNLAGDTVIDADWNSLTGEVFLATKASGVLFSGTGLRNDGLGTRALNHIRYSSADHSLLVATRNGGIRRLELPEANVPDDRPAGSRPETTSERLALRVVPNPTGDGSTTIRFEVLTGRSASIDVFDVLGRRVRTLIEGPTASGVTEWDGRDEGGRPVAAGVYVVRLRSGEEAVTRRVTVVR